MKGNSLNRQKFRVPSHSTANPTMNIEEFVQLTFDHNHDLERRVTFLSHFPVLMILSSYPLTIEFVSGPSQPIAHHIYIIWCHNGETGCLKSLVLTQKSDSTPKRTWQISQFQHSHTRQNIIPTLQQQYRRKSDQYRDRAALWRQPTIIELVEVVKKQRLQGYLPWFSSFSAAGCCFWFH